MCEQVCDSKDAGQWVIGRGRIRKWKQNVRVQESRFLYMEQCVHHDRCSKAAQMVISSFVRGNNRRSVCSCSNSNDTCPASQSACTNGLPHDWIRCLTEDSRRQYLGGHRQWRPQRSARAAKVMSQCTVHQRRVGRPCRPFPHPDEKRRFLGRHRRGLFILLACKTKLAAIWVRKSRFVESVYLVGAGRSRQQNLWVGTWGERPVQEGGEQVRCPRRAFQPNKMYKSPPCMRGNDGAIWAGIGRGFVGAIRMASLHSMVVAKA